MPPNVRATNFLPLTADDPATISSGLDIDQILRQLAAGMAELKEEVQELKESLHATESKATSTAHELMTMKREVIRISMESSDTRKKLMVLKETKHAGKAVAETTELLEMILGYLPLLDLVVTVPRINKMFKITRDCSNRIRGLMWRSTDKTGRPLATINKSEQGTGLLNEAMFTCVVDENGKTLLSCAYIQGHLIYHSWTAACFGFGMGIDLHPCPPDYTQSFADMRWVSPGKDLTKPRLVYNLIVTYESHLVGHHGAFNVNVDPTPTRSNIRSLWSPVDQKFLPLKDMPEAAAGMVRILVTVRTTAATFGDLLRVAEELHRGHPEVWPCSVTSAPGSWAPGGVTSLRGVDEEAIDLMDSTPEYDIDRGIQHTWYRALETKAED